MISEQPDVFFAHNCNKCLILTRVPETIRKIAIKIHLITSKLYEKFVEVFTNTKYTLIYIKIIAISSSLNRVSASFFFI